MYLITQHILDFGGSELFIKKILIRYYYQMYIAVLVSLNNLLNSFRNKQRHYIYVAYTSLCNKGEISFLNLIDLFKSMMKYDTFYLTLSKLISHCGVSEVSNKSHVRSFDMSPLQYFKKII